MRKLILATVLGLLSAPASAALITFEGLANGTVVTNQFAGVGFSSIAGQENKVTTQPGIGIGNNFLCTGQTGGSINCTSETILTFGSGVSGLSFYQVGDDTSGVIGKVDVFVSGLFNATVDILGFDTFTTPDLVDLTGFSDVTSIRIHSITDPGGLGWDNFSYNNVAAVPVPAAGLLLLSALGGLSAMRRRRKS